MVRSSCPQPGWSGAHAYNLTMPIGQFLGSALDVDVEFAAQVPGELACLAIGVGCGAATVTAWARRCRRGVHQRTVVPNVIAGAAVFKPPLDTCLDALRRRKHVHQETGGRIGGGQE
jgi:hypothetical protein